MRDEIHSHGERAERYSEILLPLPCPACEEPCGQCDPEVREFGAPIDPGCEED